MQAVRSSEQRLDAASSQRRYALEQYESERRRFDSGLSTVFLVLERQTVYVTVAGARAARARRPEPGDRPARARHRRHAGVARDQAAAVARSRSRSMIRTTAAPMGPFSSPGWSANPDRILPRRFRRSARASTSCRWMSPSSTATAAPVRGLAAADFTILEDGQERPVVAFSAVDLPAPAVTDSFLDARRLARRRQQHQPLEGRLVVILMDRTIRPQMQTPGPAYCRGRRQRARSRRSRRRHLQWAGRAAELHRPTAVFCSPRSTGPSSRSRTGTWAIPASATVARAPSRP